MADRRIGRKLTRLAASGDLRAFLREARRSRGRPHAFMTHAVDCGPSASCNEYSYCPWDDGGLASCRVCNLAEGALTVHCPGVDSGRMADDVYARRLDFVAGEWIRMGVQGGCPA